MKAREHEVAAGSTRWPALQSTIEFPPRQQCGSFIPRQTAPGTRHTQFFDIMASRGVYHDGWFACTFGPFLPWDTPSTGERLKAWDPAKEHWELYDLTEDFAQANDLSKAEPERLAQMKELFLAEAKKNNVLPIGGGLWTRFHPEDVVSTPYNSWRFDATTRRMPEFTAPGLGKRSNAVTVSVDVDENASGVLYALGGSSGGLTLFMDRGKLVYEYNMLLVERYRTEVDQPLPAGKHSIEIDTTLARPGAPATVVLKIDGEEVARTTVKRTVHAVNSWHVSVPRKVVGTCKTERCEA